MVSYQIKKGMLAESRVVLRLGKDIANVGPGIQLLRWITSLVPIQATAREAYKYRPLFIRRLFIIWALHLSTLSSLLWFLLISQTKTKSSHHLIINKGPLDLYYSQPQNDSIPPQSSQSFILIHMEYYFKVGDRVYFEVIGRVNCPAIITGVSESAVAWRRVGMY